MERRKAGREGPAKPEEDERERGRGREREGTVVDDDGGGVAAGGWCIWGNGPSGSEL